jgi:hypothetical protein
MKLYEVNNNKELISDFYRIPSLIYKNDPYWIPHLIQDVEMVFSKKQNVYFTHGEATRWVLKNNNNEPVGRVAAFINKKTANTFKQPTGGMGFFECINDEKAAFVLFDACKNWLSERGIQAMDGPINFGEKDKFWGLITENFLLPPYYGQNYNPEYYVSFFKNYGFNVYYNQLVFHRKVADELQEKYVIRANRISQNKAYTLKKVEKNKLEKYAEDFRIVYNRAWQTHDGFNEQRAGVFFT